MVTTPTTKMRTRKSRTWPDTVAGLGLLLACAVLLGLIYGQFRGDFTPKTTLTMWAARAGLVMDEGSKVTFNGVSIGRVAGISEVEHLGKPAAKFTLDLDPLAERFKIRVGRVAMDPDPVFAQPAG